MKAPLDYDQPRGETIELALIRHRALDPGRRVGSLFLGQGGPADAGTRVLPVQFDDRRHYLPTELVERFDIVSWDPRGVGESEPAVQCFDTEEQEKKFLTDLPRGFPINPAEEATWVRILDGFAAACGHHAGTLLAHISTADSARDLDLLRRALGEPTLKYLGVSYGTVLGATYANLFPDKVGALVLDGNLDPEKWFKEPSGLVPLSTFIRTESDQGAGATLSRFLDLCAAATPAYCAFSAGDPAATHAKFDTLLTRLRATPVTIPDPEGQPDSYTYAWALEVLFNNLYTLQPLPGALSNSEPGWTAGARLLQHLWMASEPGAVTASAAPPTTAPPPTTPGGDQRYAGAGQFFGVLCQESPNPRRTDLYSKIAEFAVHRSGPIGARWAWQGEPCANWPARAAHAYTGPWNHQTAAPILVIGNTFDPATPYQGSIAMVGRLANARLLTVEGYGHTLLFNPSSCAHRYEIDYLLTSTLPPPHTHCPQDSTPFTDK